jgi:hypothetical protein
MPEHVAKLTPRLIQASYFPHISNIASTSFKPDYKIAIFVFFYQIVFINALKQHGNFCFCQFTIKNCDTSRISSDKTLLNAK